MKKIFTIILCCYMILFIQKVNAQIVLLGDNTPHEVIGDGDFSMVRASWRLGKQSPKWKTTVVKRNNNLAEAQTGIYMGRLFSRVDMAIAESQILNNIEWQKPSEGDIVNWSLGGDVEYVSNGSISLSLVFGKHEIVLAKQIKLKGSDGKTEHFKGQYILTSQDVSFGVLPRVKATLCSENDIKIFLDYVNISIYRESKTPPELNLKVVNNEIILKWEDARSVQGDSFKVYRKAHNSNKYTMIAETMSKSFNDQKLISGLKYDYLVTRMSKGIESAPSNIIIGSISDKIAPLASVFTRTTLYDSEIKLEWSKNTDKDFASYSLFRGDDKGANMVEIASKLTKPVFEDILAPKGVDNTYVVYTYDFSGNESIASKPIKARVKVVNGTSFSDLIRPMPLRGKLTSDTWGADNVVPRDINNGIEDPAWTYWGGRPVYDKTDGKYHFLVTRWPEGSVKGHWEWPFSTVTYATSEHPMGPYKVQRDLAYDYKNGLGHNPDIILLNDGTYALYSLIDWEPTIFTSKTMKGPWKRLGTLSYDLGKYDLKEKNYVYERNLSGVQNEDGSITIVTKNGAMMISKNGLLGPYKILTDPVMANTTLPKRYSGWNYEDPVMWKDEVQYHMIINAFIAKRAIYLRSGDGVNWVFEPGLAYTNEFTKYENGVQEIWDKLERPHIITDTYGRAEYLSLAVIDVDKNVDYGNDNHSAKNVIIPLIIHRRIDMLNKEEVTNKTKEIKIFVKSEDGFDATNDIDLKSLRFGASSEVNFGRGAKVVKSIPRKGGMILVFKGSETGLTEKDFACKLLGRDTKGELLIGFSKTKK